MSIIDRTRPRITAPSVRALTWLRPTALGVDLVAAAITGVAAYFGRLNAAFLPDNFSGDNALGLPAVLMIVGWIVSIAAVGGYRREVFGHGLLEFRRMTQATLLTAALVSAGCFLAKYDLSRGFFLLGFAVGLPIFLAGRLILRKVLHSLRRRGRFLVRVLVAGTAEHVDEVVGVLRTRPWLGYSVVGAAISGEGAEETRVGVPVLGSVQDVATIAVESRSDVIFFASGSASCGQELKEHVWELEQHDIEVVIAPSLTDVSAERVHVRPVGGLPLIHLDRPTWVDASRIGKRLFDLIGSSALIVVLSPLFALAALQIWMFDRGPLFYTQQRVGRDGQYFGCLKFRTMCVNADDLIADLIAQTGSDGMLFKMKDDPRITRPGRWLRRYSVDELPQLFNVFRGDMSLVGPRPQVQREVDLYRGSMARRLLVRPGMTGLWQVSGRNDLSPGEAQKLDLFYVDNWSMLQDLSILLRTFSAVVGSHGAY